MTHMKESFIVAFLNCFGVKEEDMAVPKEIEEYREKHKASNEALDIIPSKETSSNLQQSKNLKNIDDDLEELDCEFFNNRQAFLNLCRGNHYQFDELRRAKHTSMMVLWHLHNRDAPKFVQQCVSCGREILSGTCYYCSTCPVYDLCSDCYNNPNTNRGTCTHKLEAISIEGESNQEGQSSSGGLTEEQRRERQRNI